MDHYGCEFIWHLVKAFCPTFLSFYQLNWSPSLICPQSRDEQNTYIYSLEANYYFDVLWFDWFLCPFFFLCIHGPVTMSVCLRVPRLFCVSLCPWDEGRSRCGDMLPWHMHEVGGGYQRHWFVCLRFLLHCISPHHLIRLLIACMGHQSLSRVVRTVRVSAAVRLRCGNLFC